MSTDPEGASSRLVAALAGCPWLALLLLGWCSLLTGAEVDPQQNRLAQLATTIIDQGLYEQRVFSTIALRELIVEYEAALTNSWEQQKSHLTYQRQRKIHRWRIATQRFVDQLSTALASLEVGGEVIIDATATGQVILFVEGVPTVIEGPDVALTGPLAQRIVARYCAALECAVALQEESAREGVDERARDLAVGSGFWSFEWNRGPRYESDDGLIFEFSNADHRLLKQQACEQLVRELRSLAAGLRGALQSGRMIDWAGLEITHAGDGMGHKVLLNPEGDFLRLNLPVLVTITLPPPTLLTWLHAQVRGQRVRVELLRAEEFIDYQQFHLPDQLAEGV